MTNEQVDRIVLSFQSIARSLEGLNETAKRAGLRFWPEPRTQRDSVLTRVPTSEDEAKKNLGLVNDSTSIDEWLDLGDDSGIVGERSRQWLRDHPEEIKAPDASGETSSGGPQGGKGPGAVEGQA